MNRKIIFYINTINRGGAERVLVNLANYFSDFNSCIFVTSYSTSEEYELKKNIKRINLENKVNHFNKISRNITRILRLRKILKQEKPDVIISFMGEPNYRAIISSLGLNVKKIISVRNDPNKEYSGKLSKFLAKYLLPMADGCVFQTKDAQLWFPKKLQNKSTIIFNGVNHVFYEVDYSPTKNLIISCGRLEKQKNHELLIKAFSLIKDDYKDIHLLIYGKGSLENRLQLYINENNLHEQVILKGLSTNIQEEMKKAAVFVLSSDYEGMPNALMEALAIGVPSVSTDCPCGGPKMLIENNINGILVPIGDSLSLAKGIKRILDNEQFAASISKEAKHKALEYKAENVFKEWHDYVEYIIGKKE